LQAAALKASRVHSDSMLRERTPVETQALMAYFRGDLDLRHPPLFLKATMPVLQRAMVEQFHETHVEATLTADIPPQVPLRKGMPHLALFEESFNSNKNVRHGKEMIDRMLKDVKMLFFDGNHTLKFVFHSRRTAEFYNGVSLRLQRVVIDLEDSSGLEDGVYNSAQLRRFYSIRILNAAAELGIATMVSAFSQLAGLAASRISSVRSSSEAQRVSPAPAQTASPVSSYLGSSAPSQSPPPAPTPGSEAPYSICCLRENRSPPRTNPTQVNYWLSWFQGREVNVPANGQCAILALYATVSNQEHGSLPLTPEVIADANFHKRAIYALMVENLQADCKLGILDPFTELDRLNPGCEHPKTKEAAIAIVCTYLLHERLRSVDTRVP
ncbi:hypothetical protein PHYSODRAFT_379010, partial [Phytophthora sojae]